MKSEVLGEPLPLNGNIYLMLVIVLYMFFTDCF